MSRFRVASIEEGGSVTPQEEKELMAVMKELGPTLEKKLSGPLVALKFAKMAHEAERMMYGMEGLLLILLLKGFPNGLTLTAKDAEMAEEYELYQSVDTNDAMFVRAALRTPDEPRDRGGLEEE